MVKAKIQKPLFLSLLLGLVSMSSCSNQADFRGTEMPADMTAMDFTLADQHNRPFSLSEQRGKVVLMFFGFTYCPDVCPLTLSTWKKVEAVLGEESNKVAFVYISVDPERDTREKLAEHLSIFSDNFIGLTGTQEQLIPVYDNYGVYRRKNVISESAAGYLIDHTARMNLIDTKGAWRLTFSHDAPAEDIANDIRILLQEETSIDGN